MGTKEQEIALDTNVLVRLFVDDNPAQTRKAHDIISKSRVFLSKTVFLESEWVLRRSYGYSRDQLSTVFAALMATSNVVVEDREAVQLALDGYAAGLDFADALHVASSGDAASFFTFDGELAKRAPRLFAKPAVALL